MRYSRLMLDLVGWLQASGCHESLDETALGRSSSHWRSATRILVRHHEKPLQSGKRLAQGTPEERHQVRIAAKKARYATEFFQSSHPAGRVKRYLRRLAALQDALGWLNDAAVAGRLLHKIEVRHPELAGSASFTRGCLRADTKQDRSALADFGSNSNRWSRPEGGGNGPCEAGAFPVARNAGVDWSGWLAGSGRRMVWTMSHCAR